MSNVIQLFPLMDIANGLRAIADNIDDSECESCTVVLGTEVYHLGTIDDITAASNAIWDMTYGIHKLMSAALEQEPPE